MKNFKCKKKGEEFYIENLILDACYRNAQRFPYYTPEYSVTFEPLGSGGHYAVVQSEDQKTVASAIVESFDI